MRVTVPGKPVGKGRHRTVRTSGGLRTYTPAETVSWEGLAIHIMRRHHRGPPSEEPMKVHVVAVGKRPKRLMREKDPPGRIWRTAKPDGDNILKAVCDAMTKAGIVVDDSYLSDKRVLSVYAAKGEQPCVEIEWYQLSPDGYPAVIP